MNLVSEATGVDWQRLPDTLDYVGYFEKDGKKYKARIPATSVRQGMLLDDAIRVARGAKRRAQAI